MRCSSLSPRSVAWRWLLGVLFMAASLDAQALLIEKQPIELLNISVGGEAVFSVQAKGDESLEYQWRLNGVNLPGATNSVLSLQKLRLEDFGTYSVALTDGKDSINSEPARLVPALLPAMAADDFTKGYIIGPDNDLDPFRGMFLIHNRAATKEPGEPDHAGRKGGKSIWFSWTAPLSGVVKFSARGSGFDTLLAAYDGDSVDKLRQVALTSADDDGGGFFTSEIQFNAVKGVSYPIAVDGFDGASGDIILRWILDLEGSLPEIALEPRNQVVGPGEMVRLDVDYEGGSALWFKNGQPTEATQKTFTIDQANEETVGRYSVLISAQERHEVRTVPANIQINLTDEKTDTNSFAHDKFRMAMEDRSTKERRAAKGPIVANSASRGYTTTQIFSTVGSTKDPGEPNHAGVAGGASEWYVYQPPESGTLNINTDGSNYDTVVAVYTGNGFGYETFTLVAANNRPGVNGNDRVRFATEAGVAYFIAVDGVGGASGTVKLNIHLGNPPVFSSQPQNRTVGVGTNATFTATVSATPAPSYQWYFNDVIIANATSSSYTRIGTRTNHAGLYRVLASNSVQAVYSDYATLTALIPPTISTQPVSQSVSPGANPMFSVSAVGSAPLRYQWRFGGTNLLGATNASLTITNVQSGNAGNYSVLVTNSVGSITSGDAVLTVHSAPIITAQPLSKTVAQNGSVNLLVTASGSPLPTYQWHHGSTPLNGQTDSTLRISSFSAADEGSYFVVVSNSFGTTTSDSALLALNSPLRTSAFSRTTNGVFEISAIGEADTIYTLEGTTNLINWFIITSNSSPSGFLFLKDTNTTGSALRFYRMLSE